MFTVGFTISKYTHSSLRSLVPVRCCFYTAP